MVPIQDRVEAIIKEELNRAGISAPWNMREMHVLPDSKCVVEHTSCEGTLSESLIDHHFPRITGEIEVAHFTKPEFFESIISSGELRLYSILKRLNEQEFKPFAESHGLTGYLDEKDGESYYILLMRDLYYTSFSRLDNSDENFMWNIFAERGTGVKIIFNL